MISSFDEFVRVPTDNSARESTWKRSLEHIPTSRPISLVLFILHVGIGIYKKQFRNILEFQIFEYETIWVYWQRHSKWTRYDPEWPSIIQPKYRMRKRKEERICNHATLSARQSTVQDPERFILNTMFISITFCFWIVLGYYISIKIVNDMKFRIKWPEKCIRFPTTPILASRWAKLETLVNLLVQNWPSYPIVL